MAANIGQIIPPQDGKSAPVGQAITAPGVGQVPDDEITRSPAFKQNLEWLKQPENLMTAMVFLGSVIQPKEGGRNTLQTIAQRGLGALAFRSALGDSQRQQQMEADKAAREQQQVDQQGKYQQAQIDVGNRQVDATNRNTDADLQAALTQAGLQAGIAGMNDATKRWETEQTLAMQKQLAQLEASIKTGAQDQLLTADDLKVANDIYGNSLDSQNPMEFKDALSQVLRIKILTNPKFAAYLTLFDKEQAPAAAPTSASKGKPTANRNLPSSYRSIPQEFPAVGLPNFLLGQSVGDMSKHSAPSPATRRNPILYPGTK